MNLWLKPKSSGLLPAIGAEPTNCASGFWVFCSFIRNYFWNVAKIPQVM